MNDPVAKIAELREKVRELQSELDQNRGALGQMMDNLHREFGCKTIDDAKAKLAALEKEEDQGNRKLAKLTDDFVRKHGELLG